MTRNFLEVFTLVPKETTTGSGASFSPEAKDKLEEIIKVLSNGPGAISMEFRQNIALPGTVLCIAGWESLADHDYLDVQGITTKLLKMIQKHFTSQDVYYAYVDINSLGVSEEVIGINVFHVTEGKKAEFQKEVDARPELIGAWHTVIPVPPPPKTMPADEVEQAIIQGQKLRAEQNLRRFTPAIWLTFSTPSTAPAAQKFKDAVDGYVDKVTSASYRKFISGS